MVRRPLLAELDPAEREAFLALVPSAAGFVEIASGWVLHLPGGGTEPLRTLAVVIREWDGVLRIAPDA